MYKFMYLILDLLYIIKDYFEPLLYYQNSNYYFIYNKISLKMIQYDFAGEFLWIDILNNTYHLVSEQRIAHKSIRKYHFSDQELILKGMKTIFVKRTKEKRIPESDFLFNNMRLKLKN